MNVTLKILPALLLFLLACGPRTEEVTTEQVDLAQTEPDSLFDVPKDAAATSQTHETPELVLPQDVIALLTQRYLGWKQPELGENVRRQASELEQGPFLIKGDFNDDNAQDMALQLQLNDQLLVLAITRNGDSWQIHELKKDILFNERGDLKSLYYLYLADEGTKVSSAETRQELETEKEAIALGLDDRVTIYIYENNGFEAYELAEN